MSSPFSSASSNVIGRKRVFVSSTSKDLREERLALKSALAQMFDVEFCGMEDWGARDGSPVRVCLDEVGLSHLFVGIIGNRYGHVDESSGQSVTEMEYRHAKSQQKPCLLFFLEPETVTDDARFESFKTELKKNNVVTWFKTPADLTNRVILGIHNTLIGRQASSADSLTILIAALFDQRGVRKLFESVGMGGMYEAEASVSRNVERLLESVRSSRKTERLITALQAARPEVAWQDRPAVTQGRRGIRVFGLIGAVSLGAVAAASYFNLPLPVKDLWVDEFKVANPEWAANSERADWEGSAWDAPPEWRVVKGEGRAPDDGALLLRGPHIGMRSGLGWRSYTDLDAEFKVRLFRGSRTAWVIRGQTDRRSGYIFELVNKNQALYVEGYIVSGTSRRPFPIREALVNIGTCCEAGDAFIVDAEVRSNRFRFAVTLNRKVTADPGAAGLKIAVPEFTDDASVFSHGNVGLVQLDPRAESKIERWCVSPWPLPNDLTSCIPPTT